jgi:hypothetical protein
MTNNNNDMTNAPKESSPFYNLDILQHIISFVGQNQYRFVAIINPSFKKVYLQLFPENRETYCNASTIEHAKICFEESGDYINERKLCESAAKHGNLPVLQYLRSVNCSWNAGTCARAAKAGHLHILQWCRENGCHWNERTCEHAAEAGHLHILQWCRENGCLWNAQTCAYAALRGHLHVLQWCQENGCPWDEQTCANAALGGHLHILQWCIENGCPHKFWHLNFLPS